MKDLVRVVAGKNPHSRFHYWTMLVGRDSGPCVGSSAKQIRAEEKAQRVNAEAVAYVAEAFREASLRARHELGERFEDWLLDYAATLECGATAQPVTPKEPA